MPLLNANKQRLNEEDEATGETAGYGQETAPQSTDVTTELGSAVRRMEDTAEEVASMPGQVKKKSVRKILKRIRQEIEETEAKIDALNVTLTANALILTKLERTTKGTGIMVAAILAIIVVLILLLIITAIAIK